MRRHNLGKNKKEKRPAVTKKKLKKGNVPEEERGAIEKEKKKETHPHTPIQ